MSIRIGNYVLGERYDKAIPEFTPVADALFVTPRDEPLLSGLADDDGETDWYRRDIAKCLDECEAMLLDAEADRVEVIERQIPVNGGAKKLKKGETPPEQKYRIERTERDADYFVTHADAAYEMGLGHLADLTRPEHQPWLGGPRAWFVAFGLRIEAVKKRIALLEDAFDEPYRKLDHVKMHDAAFAKCTAHKRVCDIKTPEQVANALGHVWLETKTALDDPEAGVDTLYTSVDDAIDEAEAQATAVFGEALVVAGAEIFRDSMDELEKKLVGPLALRWARAMHAVFNEISDQTMCRMDPDDAQEALDGLRAEWGPDGTRAQANPAAWRAAFYDGTASSAEEIAAGDNDCFPGVHLEYAWWEEELQRVVEGVDYLDAAWRCATPEQRKERQELRAALASLCA